MKDFVETIKDEKSTLEDLKKYNFAKYLKKLNKKLKGKTVVLYGAGVFLEAIHKHYDLSNLNIIGITDARFDNHSENETFLGYRIYSINETKLLNPDYILVSTKFYINIIEDLYFNTFRKNKFNIKPLVKKNFLTLFREIWSE